MIHKHCHELTQEAADLSAYIQQNNEYLYLLFESELFEDVWTAVSDVDFVTLKRWVWEDTRFDSYKEDGPFVVEFETNSPLLPHFIGQWAPDNAAILIKNRYGLEDLLRHLRSLVVIALPEGNLSTLRLQDPRKLAGTFNAFDDDAFSALLGPIEQVIWQENCGKLQRWLQAPNPVPLKPNYGTGDAPWFQVNAEQLALISQYEYAYFCNMLTSEIAEDIGPPGSGKAITHIPNQQQDALKTVIQQGIESAGAIGFDDQESLARYIRTCLYYPQVLEQEATRAILADTEVHANERMHRIEFWIEQHLQSKPPSTRTNTG